MKANCGFSLATLFVLASVSSVNGGGQGALANEPPVAEAGPSRYAATEPLQLDGTGSHDPDNSGTLTYAWTRVSGPPLVITGADTATPTISGFVQTNQIQECEFQLLVNDGQQASSPDTVKVVTVPSFGPSTLKLENPPFDADKPTVIYFYGGDCVDGSPGYAWNGGPAWFSRANVIDFPFGYTPDSGTEMRPARRRYYKYGDMIIAYLSAMAPDYRQAIQTMGFSTGFDPAIDVGIRLNETYRDARYAVNHVTDIDGACRILEGGTMYPLPEAANRLLAHTLGAVNAAEGWGLWLEGVQRFLASPVDGEQCWVDVCYGTTMYLAEWFPRSNILWVGSGLNHPQVNAWYGNSLAGDDMNKFNNGVIAGAYWSVIGPGKNLQLASEPNVYHFLWNGSERNGAMDFLSQSEHPGRLPEPVTLLDRHDPGLPEDDPTGIVLSCQESKNAVGYQLLSGSDPYDVAHYNIVADSNSPPAVTVAALPLSDTWWTVKVRDAYGSTIYADPVRVGQPVGVIAWWKLDEASGLTGADSVGTNNGTLVGDPIWQPAGGKIGGALQFDGGRQFVTTKFVCDPAAGPFSVFAWVKGGVPGQIIVSQDKGANWLAAATPNGTLTTELKGSGRKEKALNSSVSITDGAWHHVGFVWDGSNRILYVDGVAVAMDTQAGLAASAGGLSIGAGVTLTPGSFWSGLIDDVRIYSKAVKPE